MAGQYQGKQGLAGRQSILFYALPVTAKATTDLRSDLRVHVLCEKRGHRAAGVQTGHATGPRPPSQQSGQPHRTH
eukprot:11181835-Lingulodinium_polyedra.AAC.1